MSSSRCYFGLCRWKISCPLYAYTLYTRRGIRQEESFSSVSLMVEKLGRNNSLHLHLRLIIPRESPGHYAMGSLGYIRTDSVWKSMPLHGHVPIERSVLIPDALEWEPPLVYVFRLWLLCEWLSYKRVSLSPRGHHRSYSAGTFVIRISRSRIENV